MCCYLYFGSSLTSGQYVLQLDEQSAKYKVYCHMEARDGQECQGGGWTLVMKTDGSQVMCMRHLNSLSSVGESRFTELTINGPILV